MSCRHREWCSHWWSRPALLRRPVAEAVVPKAYGPRWVARITLVRAQTDACHRCGRAEGRPAGRPSGQGGEADGLLLQQSEDRLGGRVRLGEHGGTGLEQDL